MFAPGSRTNVRSSGSLLHLISDLRLARLGLSQYQKVLINYLAVTKHSEFGRSHKVE